MLFDTIYIEKSVREHPRTRSMLTRFSSCDTIECEHYSEVFNRSSQNFRLQKQRPSLILAKKNKGFVLPAPEGYGIGSSRNYYFSHMLNCLYDCRYCFLQGMYQSANYVLFVNYESFFDEIKTVADQSNGEPTHFFSGYDCDSLALEPVTGFGQEALRVFQQLPNALLEFRTKSTQIRSLLEHEPMDNVVVAFSLSPQEVVESLEHKTPTLARRLEAITKLANGGWKVGLRFDPIIYVKNWQTYYQTFFNQVFSQLNVQSIHSVSLGVFRLPDGFFKRTQKLYPLEPLFASPMEKKQGMMAYSSNIEQEMMDYCEKKILENIPSDCYFPCRYV